MVPPPPRRARATLVLVTAAIVAALATACVPEPGASPTSTPSRPTPSPSSPAPSTPSATPTETPAPTVAPSPTTTPGTADVDVVIVTIGVEAGAIEASGLVASSPEDGGTCRLEATQGGLTLSAESASSRGPESNFCGLLVIPADQLSGGSWSVTLGYTSPTSTGRSDPAIVEVP